MGYLDDLFLGGIFLFSWLHLSTGHFSYVSTQAGVAFILAVVTGNSPPDTIGPVIGRIAGMTGGVLVVGSVCFVLRAWPSATRMTNSPRSANDQ